LPTLIGTLLGRAVAAGLSALDAGTRRLVQRTRALLGPAPSAS